MESTQAVKRKYFSQVKKQEILKELDKGGIHLSDLARKHDLHPMTIYKWRRDMNTFRDKTNFKIDEVFAENERLKRENEHLKRAVGELTLDKQILQTANDIFKKSQMKTKLNLLKKSSRN